MQVFQKPGWFEVVFSNPDAKERVVRLDLNLPYFVPGQYVNSGLKGEHALEDKSLHKVIDTQQLFPAAELPIDKLADVLCCHNHIFASC